MISIVITTLFLIEIPLTLWSIGSEFYNPYGRFPHASLHIFDAIIILTTFVLEVVLRGKERELAGLLVILRLWRLLKLVGGEKFVFFLVMRFAYLLLAGRRRGRRRRAGGRYSQGTKPGEIRAGRVSFRAHSGSGRESGTSRKGYLARVSSHCDLLGQSVSFCLS